MGAASPKSGERFGVLAVRSPEAEQPIAPTATTARTSGANQVAARPWRAARTGGLVDSGASSHWPRAIEAEPVTL
jgi:hypothetical protein